MNEPRKHPDIFTAEEAAEYLHLDRDKGEQTLKTLREKGVLTGFWLGPGLMYHRRDLDRAADVIFGVTTAIETKPSKSRAPQLRIGRN
jgi:hypothetical protein